jgi:hypothetical protein
MKQDEQAFYDELTNLDSRIQRFADPDERRRAFLTNVASGSPQGDENIKKMKGKPLAKAAMTAGALMSGRPPATVKKSVEKRMEREG